MRAVSPSVASAEFGCHGYTSDSFSRIWHHPAALPHMRCTERASTTRSGVPITTFVRPGHEAQHDTHAIPNFTLVLGHLNRHEHHQLAERNRRLLVTFQFPTLVRRFLPSETLLWTQLTTCPEVSTAHAKNRAAKFLTSCYVNPLSVCNERYLSALASPKRSLQPLHFGSTCTILGFLWS